ncbi:hypothetical protein BCON_0008g00980 [Botryotinia convoluta]|uniref:Uncharacterized protein n=1 Tax=Botryotinia convoluta TaxID=54673 RepID=A0A4Z1IXY0_9HELO|nr:hypothetical protein BCON_0008g00980 [Botryotinia convoluta]
MPIIWRLGSPGSVVEEPSPIHTKPSYIPFFKAILAELTRTISSTFDMANSWNRDAYIDTTLSGLTAKFRVPYVRRNLQALWQMSPSRHDSYLVGIVRLA